MDIVSAIGAVRTGVDGAGAERDVQLCSSY